MNKRWGVEAGQRNMAAARFDGKWSTEYGLRSMKNGRWPMEHRIRPSGTGPDRLRGDAPGSDCGGAAKEFLLEADRAPLNKTARHNYSLPGMRVSGSFASTAH